MTFIELAEKTLEKAQTPLTIAEIWSLSEEYGFQSLVISSGKTPERTLGAQIYVSIKNHGTESAFVQVSKRPARFGLKRINYQDEAASENPSQTSIATYKERDLHSLLSSYVFSNSHFLCYTKTIHHEKSIKKKKGESSWLHPDIVGVYYPFDDYSLSTIDLIDSFNESRCLFYSFEMKIKISFSNLREYYFQAVSNSSWAHEGYLVAAEYDDGDELMQEMLRLSNSFGIGFIKLDTENVEQSEILIPARAKQALDWDTINRLAEFNSDFTKFIATTVKDIKSKEVRNLADYDKVLSGVELDEYLKLRIADSSNYT